MRNLLIHRLQMCLALMLILAWPCVTQAAVARSGDGGQVLLFPFVIAEGGWDTLVSLDTGNAASNVLKLRFLDARSGELLRSFNVYTDEGGNWRAAVTRAGSGALLRIGEGNCTIADSGEFGGAGTEFALEATTMMLEAYSVGRAWKNFFEESPTCAELAQRWRPGGIWSVDPDAEFSILPSFYDSSWFSGYFDLINVTQGLATALPATAIDEFAERIPHTAPDSNTLTLEYADPIATLPDGSIVEPPSGEGIDAIAMLLAAGDWASIVNDVITLDGIAASTDWIISFPLSGYRLYGPHQLEIDGQMRSCSSSGNDKDTLPYVVEPVNTPWGLWGGGAWTLGLGSVIDPTPSLRYEPFLCYPVNVITFGDKPPLFLPEDSVHQYRLSSLYDQPLSNAAHTAGYRFRQGLRPLVAFRVTTFVNGTLNGGSTLANYATSRPHEVQ